VGQVGEQLTEAVVYAVVRQRLLAASEVQRGRRLRATSLLSGKGLFLAMRGPRAAWSSTVPVRPTAARRSSPKQTC